MPTTIICDRRECMYCTADRCRCTAIGITDAGCDTFLVLPKGVAKTVKRMHQATNVLDEIMTECHRIRQLWGEQNHSPWQWLAILMEEVGEAAKDTGGSNTSVAKDHRSYRKEMVHVAAVAVTAMECFDRNKNVKFAVVSSALVAGEMPGKE